MPRVNLTKASVKALRVERRTDFFAEDLRTFGVRVSPSGTKTWFVLYTVRGLGRKRRKVLGHYPAMDLDTARVEALKAIATVEAGGDPAAAQHRSSFTFEKLAEEYLEKHAKPNKRTWDEDEAMLESRLFPVWGKVPAASIRKRDVIELLDEIAEEAPVRANRVRALVRAIFRFGIERDLVVVDPTLGTRKPTKETPRHRVASSEELGKLWGRLTTGTQDDLSRAVLCLVLTLQRRSEVVEMEWREVADGLWTIPARRYKTKRPQVVPVTARLRQVLREQKRDGRGYRKRVVPFGPLRVDGGDTLAPSSVSHWFKRTCRELEIEDLRLHDLRTSGATHLERLGVQRNLVARILGHSDGTVTGKHYALHRYLDEMREALEVWEGHLSGLHGQS